MSQLPHGCGCNKPHSTISVGFQQLVGSFFITSIINHEYMLSLIFTSKSFSFRAVSYMDMESGFLPIESFLKALSSMQRQPKMDSLQGIFCWLPFSFIVCLITKRKICGFSLCTYSLHFSSAQHNSDQQDFLVFTQTYSSVILC